MCACIMFRTYDIIIESLGNSTQQEPSIFPEVSSDITLHKKLKAGGLLPSLFFLLKVVSGLYKGLTS